MNLEGKRIKVPKWIHAQACVVQVEAEAVIPTDDPTEPCLEPQTLRWLDHLQALADAGQIDELRQYGTVYVRQPAA
jgi:hypothetical protein